VSITIVSFAIYVAARPIGPLLRERRRTRRQHRRGGQKAGIANTLAR